MAEVISVSRRYDGQGFVRRKEGTALLALDDELELDISDGREDLPPDGIRRLLQLFFYDVGNHADVDLGPDRLEKSPADTHPSRFVAIEHRAQNGGVQVQPH